MTGEIATTGAPVVPDLRTGEPIAVRDATTETLAGYMHEAAERHRMIGEAERIVSDELLERLDRDLQWTQTVGSGAEGHQFELRAASPSAGTTEYLSEALAHELDGLVRAGIISEAGAEKACRRRLELTLEVPWKADLPAMIAQLKRAVLIQVAGFDVRVVSAEPQVKAVAAGINALRKIAGANQALDRAQITKPTPARRVKVTLKGRL